MNSPAQKGKKTTITWMIIAAIVAVLITWRVTRGPDAEQTEPAQTAADVAKPEKATPAAAEQSATDKRAAEKSDQPVKTAQPKVDPSEPPKALGQLDSAGRRVKPKAKPPGKWTDVAAQNGRPAVNILALHGRGDTGRNFAEIARAFDPQLAWRFLEGPLTWRDSDGQQWFDSTALRAGRGNVNETVALVRAHIDAMDQPVVLFGFSQGCMTILHVLARSAHKVAAAVCIGGSVVGQLDFSEGPRVPILFVYGSGDTVVPPTATRNAIQVFENRGFAAEQIEHAGQHSIPQGEMGRIGNWMLGKAGAQGR